MGLDVGPWKTVTVAQDGTESSETDLEGEFRDVQVYNPALDNASITVKPGREEGDTAVQAYTFSMESEGDFVRTTSDRTAAGMSVFKDICARFVTIVLGAAQTSAARTFYIRGIGLL